LVAEVPFPDGTTLKVAAIDSVTLPRFLKVTRSFTMSGPGGLYNRLSIPTLQRAVSTSGDARCINYVKNLKSAWTGCVNKVISNGNALGSWIAVTPDNEDGLVWIFHIKNPHASVIVGHEYQIPAGTTPEESPRISLLSARPPQK
jgi:hypothetical protein